MISQLIGQNMPSIKYLPPRSLPSYVPLKKFLYQIAMQILSAMLYTLPEGCRDLINV